MQDRWNGILNLDRNTYHAKNPDKYYFVIKEDLDPTWPHTGTISSIPYQKGKYLLKKPGDENKKGKQKFDNKKTPFFLTKRLVEKFSRISISTNFLCSAKKIVFFLIGKKKKRLLKMIGKNEIDIPVNEIIKNAKGKVLVLTDLDTND